MIRSVWARSGIAAAATVLVSMGSVGSAVAADDTLSLKIASALRSDRLVMRAGVIGVKVKTTSGDTYDVTGPVITKDEMLALVTPGNNTIRDALLAAGYSSATASRMNGNAGLRGSNGISLITGRMTDLGVDALGSPTGIKGVAKEHMATAGLSLGYFLDDDYKWFVETYVLAAPLSTSVSATGPVRFRQDGNGEYVARPFGLEGQKILSSKLLPPTVVFGHYWGDKNAKLRPFTGAMGMYAIFYDTKATEALNTYVGGSNPGDTTVSLRNAFGLGPALGLKYQADNGWHFSLNVASVKLKTQATLTTRNTLITQRSGAAQDYGLDAPRDDGLNSISDVIEVGESTYGIGAEGNPNPTTAQAEIAARGGVAAVVSRAIAFQRGQSNLGTYVRKNETALQSTILMMSVGKSF